jgi:hypothetical protein
MPIVIVGNEKNFAGLRSRLFEGQVSRKVQNEVAQQVQEANPHAVLDKLTPGTVLTIPASANVQLHGDLSLDESTSNELHSLGEQGKALLAELVTAADEREAKARDERASALQAIDSVGSAIKKREPGLTKELASARKALQEDDVLSQQRMDEVKQAQTEWTEGLDQLLQQLD